MATPKNLNNEELRLKLMQLKSHAGFKYILDQVGIWRTQCLNELLKDGDHPEQKGEFKAYGRLINSVDAFIEHLSTNPGQSPSLDPYESPSSNPVSRS